MTIEIRGLSLTEEHWLMTESQVKICHYCGRENDGSTAACQECGTELAGPSESATERPPLKPTATPDERSSIWSRIGTVILVTFGVLIASSIVSVLVRFPLLFLVVPATAVWATYDVLRLRRRYYPVEAFVLTRDNMTNLQCSKPLIVFTVCFFNWFLGFPWYLVMPDVLKTNAPGTPDGFNDNATTNRGS